MAVIQLNTGKGVEVTHEKALACWNVLQGTVEGTEEQQKFALRVKAIYFNWRRDDIPASFYDKHRKAIDDLRRLHSVMPVVLGDELQGKNKAWKD